jgi:hypothetical protein
VQQHRSSTVARAESEDSTAPATQSTDAVSEADKKAAALYDRSFPKTGLFSIADPNAEVTLAGHGSMQGFSGRQRVQLAVAKHSAQWCCGRTLPLILLPLTSTTHHHQQQQQQQ